MKKLLASLLCVFLPLLAFAQADQTAAAPRPDIDELLTVMRIQKLSESMLDQMRNMMGKVSQGAGTDPAAAERARAVQDKAIAFIQQEMGWDKMKGEYAKIYAEVLSPDEAKGLITFYKSPAGQAFLDKQPLLMQKTMAMSQQKVMELMPRLQEMLRKEAPAPASPTSN